MQWEWREFSRLGPNDLYQILALRQRVFVVEQNCIYLDCDGLDQNAQHLFFRGGETVVAYLRLLSPGVKYREASLGRVVTAPEARASGLGRALMEEGLREAEKRFPGAGQRISAQSYLRKFYASLGFREEGEPYLEDGIPHVEMWRP